LGSRSRDPQLERSGPDAAGAALTPRDQPSTFATMVKGARPLSSLRALAAILVGTLLLTGTPGAAAEGYQPVFADGGGADAAASIYCSPGWIALGPPTIWAIPPGDAISSRTQWVAWNVTLWYSSDLGTWSPSGAVPYWYFGKVTDRWYALTYNAEWYSTQTSSWGFNNEPTWVPAFKGYYAATMQIVWYLEDGTVAMLTGQPAAYTLAAGGDWQDRAPYCAMN
jgi:hypothetical protein